MCCAAGTIARLSCWRGRPQPEQQKAENPKVGINPVLCPRYNRAANQNASSLARRFAGAAGLKLLLYEELDALAAARVAALSGLEALAVEVAAAPDALVEQVGPLTLVAIFMV